MAARADMNLLVGRLIAIRSTAVDLSPAETDVMRNKTGEAIGRVVQTGKKIVVAADMRGLQIISPDYAAHLVNSMQTSAAVTERSAFLISQHATFELQLDRLFRQAGSAQRKRFYEAEAMQRWLGEVLDTQEREHLARFLAAEPVRK